MAETHYSIPEIEHLVDDDLKIIGSLGTVGVTSAIHDLFRDYASPHNKAGDLRDRAHGEVLYSFAPRRIGGLEALFDGSLIGAHNTAAGLVARDLGLTNTNGMLSKPARIALRSYSRKFTVEMHPETDKAFKELVKYYADQARERIAILRAMKSGVDEERRALTNVGGNIQYYIQES